MILNRLTVDGANRERAVLIFDEAVRPTANDGFLAADDYFFRLPARSMRSSIGLRPAKPSSGECQWVIFASPSFQHSSTISPSTLQGKSSSPISISFTCTPVA